MANSCITPGSTTGSATIDTRHVIFIAAENAALPGGKVGGVGDVLRDLPPAIADEGWRVTVLMPSYGSLHDVEGAEKLDAVTTRFRGADHVVDAWVVPGSHDSVRNVVLDHGYLVPTSPGVVYHDDGEDSAPFLTDSNKFAFFGAAAAAWLTSLEQTPAVLHLHDWHTGVFATLREFEPAYAGLASARLVYTVHNLFYQGQRPINGDESSLEAWFPDLNYDVGMIGEPGNDDVFNPMAAAIRLADRVNTVSPTYAGEIQRPSDPERGFVGGEGLEGVLQSAAANDRLTGILNGCDYDTPAPERLTWAALAKLIRDSFPDAGKMPSRRPLHVLTSVGRLVDQKMRLFLTETGDGQTALESVLDVLGGSGVFFLLGSGDNALEDKVAAIAANRPNFIFLRGYNEAVGDQLYANGNLFLMPSSFEPCGISQMLAMRAGQPCVVHGVGGLRDTVYHGRSGFVFDGDSPREQADHFVATVRRALKLRTKDPLRWDTIVASARRVRFDWKSAARRYISELYE